MPQTEEVKKLSVITVSGLTLSLDAKGGDLVLTFHTGQEDCARVLENALDTQIQAGCVHLHLDVDLLSGSKH